MYFMDLKLTQLQKEILCGTLLGDSSLQYPSKSSKTPIFTCDHGPKQKEYSKLLSEQLNGRLVERLRYDKRTQKTYTSYTVTTLSNNEYILMYNQLYINGKKCITKDFLKNFTGCSLAYLYMDDGYTIHNTMFLCTDAYDEESCDNLINHCLRKFNIHFTKNKHSKNGFRLRLCFDDRQKFIDLVSPYMMEEMKYKIPTQISYNPHTINFKLTTLTFIERMKNMYGDIFDYSKVDYKNNHTPICLIKKWDNNELWRTPQVLLRKINKKF